MAVLVIAEHDNTALKAATHNTVTAAARLSGEIHLLVAGHRCGAVAEAAARIAGVAKILYCDAPHYEAQLAESLAALVAGVVTDAAGGYGHVLAPATTFGKNLLPRVAALRDVAQISDVVAIEAPDIFVRPIYAGNALATVKSADPVGVLTVRTTAFEAAAAVGDGAAPAPVEPIAAGPATVSTRLVAREFVRSTRPELGTARVVVSGGRGLGSGDDFRRLLGPLADKLGAALGASRAAVDAGYAPNDWQVGQTGKIVAPELYLAVGVSGAIQHLAGMKDARVIVAINKDPEAPIFQVADYGLVGDLFELVPQLEAALR